MTATRREFLSGLAAAAAGLPIVEALLALERAAGATPAEPTPTLKGALMPKTPNPLDEPDAPSHVGSLLGPITRIRDAYGWATESLASDRFQRADHAAWRRKMLAEVFAAMHYAPAKAMKRGDASLYDRSISDPDRRIAEGSVPSFHTAETVERVDCGKFVREKVYFNTTPELRVPAYVLVPKGLRGKAPGIVALHDHGGFYRWGKEKLVKLPGEHPTLTEFKQCYAGRSIADDLAEQGYVVIVIDMFFWGERRLRLPDDVKPDAETADDVRAFNASRQPMEQLVARTIFTSGFTWAGLIFWDDIRTLDYLASRPEVDASRLGCVGLSVGAWRAAHLAALDERIKAAVAVCWLSSFKDIQAKHTIHTVGFTKVLPGLYRRLDMPDVVSLAAPRALLCINGLKDGLFPVDTGVKPAYRTLETVYAKLGAPEKFRGHLYDTPHEFNLDMQHEAWDWLKRWV